MDEMFKNFEFNEKSEISITEVNGIKLPSDYIDFMKEHNGGEGPIGNNNYGRFYKLEELEKINNEYEVQPNISFKEFNEYINSLDDKKVLKRNN